MAKSHFAIERPRRISIFIEGYNAEAQALAQKRKQQERSRRLQRKADAAAKELRKERSESARRVSVATREPELHAEDLEALEALNRAAAVQPLSGEVERELRAAFADERGAHANE